MVSLFLSYLLLALPFSIGERIVYSVKINFLKVGNLELEIIDTLTYKGEKAYKARMIFETKGLVSSFISVADTIYTIFSKNNGYSLFYEKRLKESKYKAHLIIEYNQSEGEAVYSNGKKYKIKFGSIDPLNMFYFIRRFDLKVGDTLKVPYHVDGRNQTAYFIVVKEKKKKGKVYQKILFNIKGAGIFKGKGLEVWFSKDSLKIPVELKVKVFFGSMKGKLVYYELGRG